MNFTVRPAAARSPEAQALIAALDSDLERRYPGEPTNGIQAPEFEAAGGYFAVVATAAGEVIACGAFRAVEAQCVEIKRMFVREDFRRRGVSRTILRHLEEVARERGFRGAVLETGVRQPEAIGLYTSEGYFRIPNYGEYAGSPASVCFAKTL